MYSLAFNTDACRGFQDSFTFISFFFFLRPDTNDAKIISTIISKIIWNKKRKAELTRNFSPIGQIAETSTRDPDTSGLFNLFHCQSTYFIWKIFWLWENTAKRNIKRHRVHWTVLVSGCLRLFVLHTRLNSDFRSVLRFVSNNISDVCIVCTQTVFSVKKQKCTSSKVGFDQKLR